MITVISEAGNKVTEAIRIRAKTKVSADPNQSRFIKAEIRNLKDQIGLLEALLHAEGDKAQQF